MKSFKHTALVPAVVVLAAIGLAGCGKEKEAKTVPVDPAVAKETQDWLTLKADDGSVSIKVPTDWVPDDPKSDAYKSKIGPLAQSNPQIKQLAARAPGVLLVGLRADPRVLKSGVVDNVNLSKTPGGGKKEITDQDLADAKKEYLAKLPLDGPFEIAKTNVPAGPAMRYTADIKFTGPGGKPVPARLIGYLVIHGGDAYGITYLCARERSKEMEEIAAKSIQTLGF